MNWDDPAARYNLLSEVGPAEYNRRFEQHLEDCVVSRVAGHCIRPVNTRFGRLFSVGSTGKAFGSQQQAEQYALENPAV